MMTRFVRGMFQVGTHVGNIGAASVGCFAFMRGFSLIAMEKQAPNMAESICDVVPLRKPFVVSLSHKSIWPRSRSKGWRPSNALPPRPIC
jgi:hypothetical protein